jgi:hypothetical protein
MKNLKNLFILFSLLFSNIVFADDNQAYLRRASLLIRGVPANFQDLAPVANMNDEQFEKYLDTKMDEYMLSPLFVEKMRIRLLELFQMQVTSLTSPKLFSDSYNVNVNAQGAFDNFIQDLVKNNQSWDNLLLGNSYRLDLTQAKNELDFFQNVLDVDAAYQAEGSMNLQALNNNQQNAVAGVLTTPRFYDRFFNTKLNENRKRAAAIFRIFLCDRMQPVLLLSTDDKEQLINKALNQSAADQGMQALSNNARHGADPQCKSCHYKLDPLGKAFALSGDHPTAEKISGKLTFKKADGSMVNVSFNNIRGLAEAISKQSEYVSCQTQHFWNWFVGEDTPIENKSALEQKFTSLDKKPKEFIKHILTATRKMSRGIKEDDIRFSQVQPIFNRCNSCHASVYTAPSVHTQEDWKADADSMLLAQDVIRATNLHESGVVKMPPRNAGWSLEGKERELVKAWLKGGAKLNNGEKVYKDAKFNSEVVKAVSPKLSPYLAKPSFNNTSSRMMQNLDFYESIKHILGLTDQDLLSCSIDRNARNAMGFMDPATGARPSPVPTVIYYQTISKCAGTLRYYKPKIFDAYGFGMWRELKPEQQDKILTEVMNNVLGPQVLSPAASQKVFERLKAYTKSFATATSTVNVQDAAKANGLYLILMPEFLTY